METPTHHLERVDEADISSMYACDSTASLTHQRAVAGYFSRAPPLKDDVDDTPNPRVVSWDGMQYLKVSSYHLLMLIDSNRTFRNPGNSARPSKLYVARLETDLILSVRVFFISCCLSFTMI